MIPTQETESGFFCCGDRPFIENGEFKRKMAILHSDFTRKNAQNFRFSYPVKFRFPADITPMHIKLIVMKKTALLLLLSVVGFCGTASAQLSGVLTIPGSYPTLAAAITDLNTQGVGAGGVIFNLLAGNPQTAPNGGYIITTTTGTAANPIVFAGNGNTITASAALTAGILHDAIFEIRGADYIGITGFVMIENPANTNSTPATNNMTEWGVALLAASATNGAQNNSIYSNSISLNRSYTNTFGVYSNTRHSATAVTTTIDPSATSGANSFNSVLQNTISNVNMGITFIGSSVAANMDVSNVIGSPTMGNNITNWGGAAAATGYVSNSGTSYCIFVNHQRSHSVRGNTIVSASVAPTVTFRGIVQDYTTTAPTGSFSAAISGNTITMTSAQPSGVFRAILVASQAGGTSIAMNVDSNLVQNCAVTGVGNSVTFTAILIANNLSSINARFNRVLNNTSAATTGGFIGLQVTSNITSNSQIQDNSIGNGLNDAITFTSATSGAIVGLSFTGTGTGAGTGLSISNNVFRGFSLNATASSNVEVLQVTGSATFMFVINNSFLGLAFNTTGNVTVINNIQAIANVASVSITGNVIVTSLSKTANGGSVTCIAASGNYSLGSTRVVQNNILSAITTMNSTITGINETGGPAAGILKNITGNTLSNWSTSGAATGINIDAASGNSTVSSNAISNTTCTGNFFGIRYNPLCSGTQTCLSNTINSISGAGAVHLISFSGASIFTSMEVAGNILSSSTSSSATFGAIGIDFNTGGAFSVHDNVIFDLNSVCSTSDATEGMFVQFNSGTSSIFANKIYDIENTNAAGGAIGIHVNACATLNIYNNYIGDLRATLTAGNSAVIGLNVAGGTTVAASYNTVYLNNAAGGSNSGSTCARISSVTNYTQQNNLFVNRSAATGTGLAVAYTRTTTSLATYNNASNNNSYYAGTPSATHLIFSDGTNSDQTLAQFQTRVGPTRDAQSISVDPTFSSTNGNDPDFLHIPAATASLLESGGTVIGTILVDWDTDARPGPVGSVNGGALAPDIGADEFDGILATCSGTPTGGTAITTSPASQCPGNTFDLELTGHSTGTAFTYQWQESTINGGPYTNIIGATSDTYTTPVLSSTMYYVCIVTCTVSGLSASSSQQTATIYPGPVLSFNPAAPELCSGGSPVNVVVSGANTYTWSPGTGLSSTTINNPDANPAATTTYTVVGTSIDGCTSSETVTVTVNPLPTLVVSATPTNVCSGGSTTLTASGASTYLWQPMFISGSSVSDSPVATTTYTVTGTDVNGCVNSETITVTVSPSPTVTATADFTTVCAGSPVTLTGSGATTYVWNPGALTSNPQVVTPMSTTQYTVTGTDGSGCTATDMITITVNPVPTVSALATPAVICAGDMVTLDGSGAVTYTWMPGSLSGASVNDFPATTTTYTVTGDDGSGCTGTATVLVTVNPLPVLVVSATPSSICIGDASSLSASGASTYFWFPGFLVGTPVSVSPAATTTYTVVGTDVNGCSAQTTVGVTVNPLPTVTASSLPSTICEDDLTTLTGNGATTYLWMPGSLSGASVMDAPSTTTTYTVTGTDVNGCTGTDMTTVNVNPAPTVGVTASATLICQGSFSMMTASGASSYTWMPGSLSGTSVIVSPIATTTYTVTGTDGLGCSSTATITITVNPPPVVSISGASTYCQGGSTVLTSSAGATYQWYLNGVQVLPATSQTIVAVAPGVYNCMVADAAGCSDSASTGLTLIENPSPVVTFTAAPSLTVCAGTAITLSGSGATSYAWSGGITDATPFTPASSGSYTVTGTDGNGCTDTDVAAVVVNPLPTVSSSASPASSVCAGSSVTLSGSGATSYSWTGGVTDGVPFTPASTLTYTVTGTDGNGCTNTNTITVTVNPLPAVGTVASPGTTICSGSSVTLNGTNAVSYVWTGGVVNGVPFSPAITNTYTVTGTDVNGCTNSATIAVTVNPTPTVSFTAAPSTSVCTGTPVTLSGTGATSYAWTGGVTNGVAFTPPSTSTYTVTGTDASGCTGTATVTVTVNPAPTVGTSATPSSTVCTGSPVTLNGTGASSYAWSGGVTDGVSFIPPATATYTVTGTSGSGCTNTATILVTVNPLPTVGATATPGTSICSGSSVTLNGTGATSYAWSSGVTNGVAFVPPATSSYVVTGTNGSGCTNTATITVTVNPLPTVSSSASPSGAVCPGTMVTLSGSGATSYVWTGGVTNGVPFSAVTTTTYTVTGTDVNGCTGTSTQTVTVNPAPTVSASASPATSVCAGTMVTLSGSGATTYTWTGGVSNGVPFAAVSTTTYTVTGTDALGCSNTATIAVTVNPLPTIGSTASPSNTVCTGTMVTLNGTGGSSYLWTGGVTNGVPFSATATTTYTVTGTDVNGCTNTATTTITVNPSLTVTAAVSPSSTVCSGTMVTLNGFGGSSYSWTGGVTDGVPFSATATTTYTVTGSDVSGCTGTATITVTVDPTPNINSVQSPAGPVCAGNSVTLNGIGGVSYTWTGGVTDGVSFVPVATATYTVTGTGFTGCTNTNTITVVVNPVPTVSSTASPATTVCAGTAVTLNGTGAMFYSWTGGVSNGVAFTPVSTQTYTVTGTDGNGCFNTATTTITVNPVPVVSSTTSPASAVCAGTAVTLNGTGAVSYAWSSGVTNGVAFTPVATATYAVTGTGANGCTASAVTTVTVNPLPVVGTNVSPAPNVCAGTMVTLSGTGATSYVWTGGVTDNVPFTAVTTNSYTVTGTDANGCVNTSSLTINVTTSPTVSYVASPGITICAGTQLTLDGAGAITYTWSDGIVDGNPFTPIMTDTVTVVGTDGNGCMDSTTVIITVNPLPVVTTAVTPNDSVCENTMITLSGSGAATYVWSHSVVDNVAFTATATTTYTVIGTSGAGCSDTTTQAVTVNPAPVVSIAGNSTFCTGGNTMLTSSAGTMYQWFMNGSPLAGETASTYTATTAGVYNVWVTNASGCADSSATGVNVTINALPTVVANASATTICDGSPVTLTGSGATSYAWSGGVNDGIAFSPLSTLTYTVVGTASNGCTDTDTITVAVNALPVVSTSGFPAYIVCENTMVTLNGNGAATYLWTGGIMDGVPFSALATNTYTVTGTDLNGCTNTASVTVTVNAVPVVTLGPDSTQCGSIMLDAGNAGATYLWSTTATSQTINAIVSGTYMVDVTNASGCTSSDTVVLTINTQPVVALGTDDTLCAASVLLDAMNPGATYLWNDFSTGQTNVVTTSGTYFVTATMPGGCSTADTITLVLNTPPNVTLSLALDTACLNMGSVMLSGESPAGGTWSGPAVSGNTFDPMIAGVGTFGITYMFTDTNGCSGTATDSILVDPCLGIEAPISVVDFSMYPNPNNGDFNLLISGNDNANVFIYNAAGQIVFSEQVSGGVATPIALEASGIYMVTVVMSDGTQMTQRVIVNR